jgi:hypothetical protein
VCARLNDGGLTRYLYAQQLLMVTPSVQPPVIDGATLSLSAGAMHFDVYGFPGQQVTIMTSTDLLNWSPLDTHTFTGNIWSFVDAEAGNFARRFYRAALAP